MYKLEGRKVEKNIKYNFRHIVNLFFIQRIIITMFTQIITMFTQYFKECQPFFLTFTTGFSKSWHRLNEPFEQCNTQLEHVN